MNKLYIIAWTWKDIDLTIETFHTPYKCVRRMSELITDFTYFRKADAEDDPEMYISEFYDWVREENDNRSDINITLEIIEI